MNDFKPHKRRTQQKDRRVSYSYSRLSVGQMSAPTLAIWDVVFLLFTKRGPEKYFHGIINFLSPNTASKRGCHNHTKEKGGREKERKNIENRGKVILQYPPCK
jgi:hypothetical protein